MSQAAIDALLEHPGVERLAGEQRERFLRGAGVRVLLITGEPGAAGVGDLVVVVRELLKDFGGRLHLALAERGEEALFREEFGIDVLPSVVFFRDGRPAALVPGLKRWEEYAALVRGLLGEPDEDAPEINPFVEAALSIKGYTSF